MPASSWATGVAEVISQNGRGIVVRCCHCGDTHKHGRQMLGSASVIAGCHVGRTRCREYRIPDLGVAEAGYRAPAAQVDVVAGRQVRRDRKAKVTA